MYKAKSRSLGWGQCEHLMFVLFFVPFSCRFQQFFCHVTTMSGYDRELSAHFYSAASLKYHAPDT